MSEIIGKRVRQARNEAGLSQRELGERIESVLGRPWFPQAVSAAERGLRDWTADDLVAVAWVLKRPVAWFFRADEEDRWQILDLGGKALIHADWAGGEVQAEPTAQELAEIASRALNALRRHMKALPPTVVIEPDEHAAARETEERDTL